jgi:predicted TIM-barrel fold metal-dependent hydrolase
MDDQGVDVQVLSVTTPGVQNLEPEHAVTLAREANDMVAAVVADAPDRFQALATLPTPAPQAAADELKRAVTECGLKGAMLHGRTGSMHLDHPAFEPVWRAAAELRCPISLHPQLPSTAIREAYYTGIDPTTDFLFSSGLIGWHYEIGVELLRLILSGTLDRYPELRLIANHWGEVVLFYIDRLSMIDGLGGRLARPFEDYLRSNVWFTGSGNLSQRCLRWTKDIVGAQRILYASDYPYIDTGGGRGRAFIDESPELTDLERDAIAHGNWQRLTAHLR